jgi:hypothetical protein
MPEHVFREVHPDEFEQHIQRAAQTNLDQVRDYAGKKTYLNQDNTVGYALRNDGYWGNLFSFAKGGGAAAAQDAIARGALWGTAFDRPGPKNLIEHYKGFGMKPFAREKNWEEGGPDMVYVKFDHAPIPEEVKHKIEQGIARPESEMVKMEKRTIFSILRRTPHPHSYEWHDGHSVHHKTIMKADEDAGKSFEHATNEQVATVGVPTYAEYAKHYGTINKGVQSHDSAYNYKGLSDKINDLIKQHGYQVYYAGGKYGKPDLATKNYDTNHLMIYDPTPDSGGDQGDFEQTDNWRKVHELAHALTREQVNNTQISGFGDATYGERPRMGRLGKQRTLRDAMRAIHWEALAVQKQRELSEQLGLKVSQEDFNREWNTNQHDATHRAVTGRFSEPRKEGFHPSTTPVPIEFSLGLARKAAEQMGMKGLDELKGMTKSENTVDKYEKSREILKACWEGYKMIGTKEKGGKTVPNCVPKKKAEELLGKTEELLELIKDEKKYSKKVTNPETGREKTVKYGAKGYTIAPGTSRGDSYCARSAGQMKDHPAAAKDPNSPLRLSRKKWKCSGSKSTKKSEENVVEVDPSEYLTKAQELLENLRKATP